MVSFLRPGGGKALTWPPVFVTQGQVDQLDSPPKGDASEQWRSNLILSIGVAFLVGLVLKPFLSSYSSQKGENLATKEDIAQLTKIAEGIKAEISDKVWDRQRQWEMRRDALLEAVRAMKELELELLSLRSAHLTIQHFASPGAMGQRKNSMSGFLASSVKFYRSIFVSELSVGVDFGSKLLAYMEAAGSIAKEFEKGNPDFCTSEKFREILDLSEQVLETARKKLNIKGTVQAAVN